MNGIGEKNVDSPIINRKRVSPWPAVPMADALESIKRIRDAFQCETECLAISELPHGIVLAEDIYANENIPRTRTSIKDGYAVRVEDEDTDRKVVGVSTAGKAYSEEVKSGECVRVSTGGVVPPGCDAVIQVEDTILLEHDGKEELMIGFKTIPKLNQDIREVGSDVKEGTLVLGTGTEIWSAEIGLLTSLGFQCIEVHTKPRICVVSTGNEFFPRIPFKLVESYVAKVPEGFIRDSNRPQLLSLFSSHGFQAIDAGIAADEPKMIEEKIREASRFSEIIVTSGGVSMGEKDHLKEVLMNALNFKILFGRVWMKPGMPCTVAHGSIDGKEVIVFALPGNPVSSWVCAHVFVLPFLRHLAGMENPDLTKIKVTLGHDVDLDRRPEYCRAILDFSTGTMTAHVLGSQLSSRITSMVNSHVLLSLPEATTEQPTMVKGSVVDAYVIARL